MPRPPSENPLPVARGTQTVSAKRRIAIIGGGPAGLRAAEVAALGGAEVTVFEGESSVGRKFLVAGRSGLNLTQEEPIEEFLQHYSIEESARANWNKIIRQFDPDALRAWARELGVETFVSKGKVLPLPIRGKMRTTPLLRNWLLRLRSLGVRLELRQRWTGFEDPQHLTFEQRGQVLRHSTDATVLALGGASWPGTGSDGSWQQVLGELGIQCNALEPSNCGWEIPWPEALLAEVEGHPLKNLAVRAGELRTRGDLVVTRYGLEGPPIYRLGPQLRRAEIPTIEIDFKPDVSRAVLLERMGQVQRNFVREARRRLNLGSAVAALLKHLPGRGPWRSAEDIVDELKHCRIALSGPRPVAEAISSAGGLPWSELDDRLQLRKLPGVFGAGEMLDWDAPTGGYLLQGCFSSGDHAGRHALAGRAADSASVDG